MDPSDPSDAVRDYLLDLQDRICAALEGEDGEAAFTREEIPRPGGGLSRPRVLCDGPVIEKAAVNFSHTRGVNMPPTATARRPELAGRSYEAVSVSLIVHPRNPYAPTCHANFRSFVASAPGVAPVAWFGGGFDLTPYYGFEADARHWHRTARDACAVFGPDAYDRFKKQCDEYFYLPHREEPRGVGGVFFDDLEEGGFERCFAFVRSVGDAFVPAYQPILALRKSLPWGERERAFQLFRRGRYVEFNLLYDRGTKYGLQTGARAESVLASLPPLVAWRYDYQPEPGTPEARLTTDFLRARDWASEPCAPDDPYVGGAPRAQRRGAATSVVGVEGAQRLPGVHEREQLGIAACDRASVLARRARVGDVVDDRAVERAPAEQGRAREVRQALADTTARVGHEAHAAALAAIDRPEHEPAHVGHADGLGPVAAEAPDEERRLRLPRMQAAAVAERAVLVDRLAVVREHDDGVRCAADRLAEVAHELLDRAIDVGGRVQVRAPHLLAVPRADAGSRHGIDVEQRVEIVVVIGIVRVHVVHVQEQGLAGARLREEGAHALEQQLPRDLQARGRRRARRALRSA